MRCRNFLTDNNRDENRISREKLRQQNEQLGRCILLKIYLRADVEEAASGKILSLPKRLKSLRLQQFLEILLLETAETAAFLSSEQNEKLWEMGNRKIRKLACTALLLDIKITGYYKTVQKKQTKEKHKKKCPQQFLWIPAPVPESAETAAIPCADIKGGAKDIQLLLRMHRLGKLCNLQKNLLPQKQHTTKEN